VLIIASFILSLSGCGYKDDPTYIQSDSKVAQNNKVEQQ
jgi:predicted small lipoprotein YifL